MKYVLYCIFDLVDLVKKMLVFFNLIKPKVLLYGYRSKLIYI